MAQDARFRVFGAPHRARYGLNADHMGRGRGRCESRRVQDRWRPDKAPRQCTMERVAQPITSGLRMLHPSKLKRAVSRTGV